MEITLSWPGKGAGAPRPATLVTLERHGAAAGDAWRNRLVRGDNLAACAALLPLLRGQVDLCYLDPPYATGADFSLTTPVGGRRKHVVAQAAYSDSWTGAAYLQMLYERLLLVRELLADTGSIYAHLGHLVAPYARLMLDEIFGPEQLIGEIIWKRADAHNDVGQGARRFGAVHDTILAYGRTARYRFQPQYTPLPDSTVSRWYRHVEAGSGRRYNRADLTARKPGGDTSYEWRGVRPPPGRYWAYSRQRMEQMEQQGLLVYSSRGTPYMKRYLDESRGVPLQDVWTDIPMLRGIHAERTGYPTEKPEPLLERILGASSAPGELVLDPFCGSGTTLAVAERLGRRWIGCDAGRAAIHLCRKRLLGGQAFDVLGTEPQGPAAQPGSGPVSAVGQGIGSEVQVALVGYTPGRAAAGAAGWADYIDYWAVDFEHGGEALVPGWCAARGRPGSPVPLLSAAHRYGGPGPHRIAVQVVDIHGEEHLALLSWP